MKIITQKPILVITAEEKAILERAKKILHEIINEDDEVINEIDMLCSYDDISDAWDVIDTILEEATTANSNEAKYLVVEYTAELVIG
jgi:hypothetical protein